MRTSCSHCGTPFKVPDKTLGKQAKCKSCGKMFVITPASGAHDVPMQEFSPPSKHGSTTQMHPVKHEEAGSGDPLDALADAAIQSGSHMRPVHGTPASSRHRDFDPGDDGRDSRVRKAKGAGLAMGLGIAAAGLGVIGFVLGLIAMFVGNQDVMIGLGLFALLLIALTALLGMLAVVNGSTAKRHIRRARHPLAGRGDASTGIITGWIALALVFIALITAGIWLANRGGITFEKQLDSEGNPIAEGTETNQPDGSNNSPVQTQSNTGQPATGGSTTPGTTSDADAQAAADAGKAAAAGSVFLLFVCFFSVFSLVAFAFWLWMLIDCCTTTFPPEKNDKTMWVLIIIFLGGLGALIYFFAGRPKKSRNRGRARYAH